MNAASHRFADAVRAGRAEFRTGLVEDLPLPDSTFDKALSVHTVYFWQSLRAGSAELHRVLKPGGRDRAGLPPEGTYGPDEHAGRCFLHLASRMRSLLPCERQGSATLKCGDRARKPPGSL
ncbi:methyltransferase domain-containing protein [Mesorhizobium sp. M0317]|uniref:class I SAM-dependent methyltransferase n=1 Tax=Mesorhizobium sp. M0317 TaxID=2956935 RepID=UPI00333A9828